MQVVCNPIPLVAIIGVHSLPPSPPPLPHRSASVKRFGWYAAWRWRLLMVHPSGSAAAKSASAFDLAAFDGAPLPLPPTLPRPPPMRGPSAPRTLARAAAVRSAAASRIKSSVAASCWGQKKSPHAIESKK